MIILDNRPKGLMAAVGFTFLIASLSACDQGPSLDSDTSRSGTDQDGYYAGYEFGIKLAEMRQQQPGVELDNAFKGMLDALSDRNQPISRTDLCATQQPAELKHTEVDSRPAIDVQPPQTEARSQKFEVFYAKDDYAAINAQRPDVITLPSGVQYEVLKAGGGNRPQASDAVLISYVASLSDGTVFDATADDGEPMYLSLDDIVVPGLKEALLLMNEGDRWKVVIPPSMGFSRIGNRMFHRRDLIYDITLISIDKPKPAKTSD